MKRWMYGVVLSFVALPAHAQSLNDVNPAVFNVLEAMQLGNSAQMVTIVARCGIPGEETSEAQKAQAVDNFIIAQQRYMASLAKTSTSPSDTMHNQVRTHAEGNVKAMNKQISQKGCQAFTGMKPAIQQYVSTSQRAQYQSQNPRAYLPPQTLPGEQAETVLGNIARMQ
jgi:hypothetical protein